MKTIFTIAMVMIAGLSTAQSLEDYLKMASENNPGLQSRYKGFEASMERVAQVSALPDPNFTVSAFGRMLETRTGPQQAIFILNQMFPWCGTLKAKGDASALMADAIFQSYLDARNKLYFKVSAAYYPLYELRQWIKIEEENIKILQSYKAIANVNFQNSKASMVDVLRVDIMLKDAQTNLGILKEKEKPLLTTFNTLLNRGTNEQVVIPDDLNFLAQREGFRKDSLLVQNPQLEEIELKIKSAEAAERAAHKQGLPMIGVGLNYTVIGKRADLGAGVTPPQGNGQDAIMPMISLSLPIYRKKYKSAVKEAKLMQESYSLQKEEVTNTLLSSYETTSFEMKQQSDLIKLYEKQISETQQALDLLFTAYGNSGKDFEEVLRMQQQLLKYDKMKASSEAQYQIALAKINYITSKTY